VSRPSPPLRSPHDRTRGPGSQAAAASASSPPHRSRALQPDRRRPAEIHGKKPCAGARGRDARPKLPHTAVSAVMPGAAAAEQDASTTARLRSGQGRPDPVLGTPDLRPPAAAAASGGHDVCLTAAPGRMPSSEKEAPPPPSWGAARRPAAPSGGSRGGREMEWAAGAGRRRCRPSHPERGRRGGRTVCS
jgi:hypothetical protein